MTSIPPAEYKADVKYSPGDTLRQLINELNINKFELSDKLNISIVALENLLKGNYPISSDLALRLELATNLPNSFWLNLERQWRS